MDICLNEEQSEAVRSRGGPWVCVAGPGSGKTQVIAQRYLELLKAGISPNDILSLTFTEQAAKGMGIRAGFGTSQKLFRTFHSYCLEVLRNERERLPYKLRPEVLGLPPDIFELVCDICKIHNNRLRYQEVMDAVSRYKMQGISPERAIDDAIGVELVEAMVYRDYDRMSKERGWLDFDSLIVECVKLFETHDDVVERNQFMEVQVDEAQDTDTNQMKLLKMVTRKHGNIFVVGDENQLIYEWRSAMPGSLSNFYQRFPGAKKLYLGTNYRSTQKLVEFFKKIVPVDNGLASHMRAAPGAEEGMGPTFTRYRDETEEMEKVLAAANDPENSAILARTNRQLWHYENACIRKNIKYRLLGKTGFWEQGETKKLVDLIKEHKQLSGPAGPIVKRVIEQSGILHKYRKPFKFGEKDPQENINEAYIVSQRFDSISEFLKYVNRARHAHKNKTGLTLSTVHQMKGKEAHHIFLTGCSEGLLPHERGESAEERRIFFVACTRAAKFLHVSWYGKPSMFILPFLTEDAMTIKQIPGTQQALF